MLIDFSITIAVTTTTLLVWRALLLDHAALLTYVQNIPLIGGALTCGFCSAVWLSLVAVLIHNPLVPLALTLPYIVAVWVAWFTVSFAVIIARNTATVLIEATGALTHIHRDGH